MSTTSKTATRTALSVLMAAILAVIVFLPAFGQDVSEEFHQTYSLSATGTFGLDNINGDVRIVGWDRNEVKIDAVKTASTQERLNDLTIEVDATSDSVYVRTKYPQANSETRDGGHAEVEYTAWIPRSATVEKVKLVNGSLTTENLGGRLEASTVNGRIAASGLGGDVQLSSVNGKIEATYQKVESAELVKLNTVNGEIWLALPGGTGAHVRATSVHGEITNDFGLPVTGKLVGRSLEGQILTGGPEVDINTVNGPISITEAGKI